MLPAAPVTATRIGDLAMLSAPLGCCARRLSSRPAGPQRRSGPARPKSPDWPRLPRRGLLAAMFEIDPAFLATSEALGELALCHVRLQADARFPWIVLIPRVAGARELEDLADGERDVLM